MIVALILFIVYSIALRRPQVAAKPRSCNDLKQQGNSYFPNGENLIFPEEKCYSSIKVYCRQDTSIAVPKEYITVKPSTNYVDDWRGSTKFWKVSISLKCANELVIISELSIRLFIP